jgi:hypothetical protein
MWDVIGDWRKLLNDEFSDLAEEENVMIEAWWGSVRERDNFEKLGVDGMLIIHDIYFI